MRTKKFSSMVLCVLLVAAFLYGCGSSKKEGTTGTAPENVAEVGDTACFQCHAATADPLTGDTFIEQYKRSTHSEIGCESCHGGGAEHNGIGPFPYILNSEVSDAQIAQRCAMCHNGTTVYKGRVAPLSSSINFQNGNHANPFSAEEAHEAKCSRCHSHEGAVLQGIAGYTGDRSILDNAAYEPVLPRDPETFNTIRCETCHEHGANLRQWMTRDAVGNVVAWDPNKNFVNDQIDLCTGCHTLTTNDGKLIGSGNILTITTGTGTTVDVPTAAFYHNTRWFRTLPSTHYDQPDSTTVIEGYVVRKVTESVKNPCFDCHGHEYKTNTRALADRPERGATIFTDWGQSGHAGKVLNQKVAAAATASNSTTAQVDAVMKAGVIESTGAAWVHYDWDATLNADGTSNRGECQMCHTSTGFANFVPDPVNYDFRNNDFSHLSGWKKASTGVATVSSGQNELLYCWGCHSNAGLGVMRRTGDAYLSFTINNQPIIIQNVGKSAVCVVCHGGRGSVGASVLNDSRSSRFQGHHAPTAGIMFASQTHIAYEYAGKNYDNPAFKHYQINADTDGPCASCHMAGANHSFEAVTTSGGVITAINNQALCDTCHAGFITPATITAPKEGFAEASTVLNNYLANAAGFTNYLGYAITSSNYADRVAVPDNAYGAWQNGKIIGDEPCAYVHNPTYIRRIIFDSIDFMDNGVLNGTISFDATAFPKAATWFYKPGASGVTTFNRP